MEQTSASEYVRKVHDHARATLPFADKRDFDDANRGFIAKLDPGIVKNENGEVVWNNDSYDFLDTDQSPDTVHPSLWRVSRLNIIQGLFEVVPGIYQVRGLDLSNMTIIEGDNGIIVLDTMTTREPAAAALQLYREHRGDRPVVAVIYTHSHVDHFGGVLGVTDQAAVDRGEVKVIAPAGFTEHAVSENVYAGVAMGRRAGYMYGAALDRGPSGQVGAGLGQSPSTGSVGLIVPTDFVTHTGQKIEVDGVVMEFQLTPNTEAPAEMHIYFERYKALCAAENATHTMHNLLTLRGALVRDPHGWSRYLTEAIELFAGRSEVAFSPHHWPTWGGDNIRDFLSLQRDLYLYLHDQTLRMINKGMQGAEIAEAIVLPPALENAWHTRGYYGSVSHNVKAIYQRYMGWFDGNPARLWPHPPAEIAKRYVAAIGGVGATIKVAQDAYDSGDYRWAATLLDHVVFVDPDNAAGRALYANTLDQLAYGIENGTWRNFFLSGATELRGANFGSPTSVQSPELLSQLTPTQIFDAIAIRVDGPKAWDLDISLDVNFADSNEDYRLHLKNGVLVHRLKNERDQAADAGIIIANRLRMLAFLAGDQESPGLEISGDGAKLGKLISVLDDADPAFNIVLP